MMVARWATALDLYDGALLDFGAAMTEHAGAAQFGFELPDGLGPLPPELHARARQVGERAVLLERRLHAVLAELAYEQARLTRARRPRPADRPRPRFVDVES